MAVVDVGSTAYHVMSFGQYGTNAGDERHCMLIIVTNIIGADLLSFYSPRQINGLWRFADARAHLPITGHRHHQIHPFANGISS